jgi:hypothetical protein
VKKLVINGREIAGNLIPVDLMKDANEVVVEMGKTQE